MRSILFMLVCAFACACGGSEPPSNPSCDVTVLPSTDDQTAVQEALVTVAAGQTICFEGTYTFTDELTLSQDDVTLLATGGGALFDFAMQTVGANGVRVQAVDGFRMEGIHVHDTPGDGIRVENSTDVELVGLKVVWTAGASDANGAYGLYPVGCTNVLIDECEVSGARDAGIYVGQSSNIIVRNSLAYDNVAGIEIENSTNADVHANEARNNTAGILVFDLPGLPAGNGGGTHVYDNDVYDNNRMNFAEMGTIVSNVPHGLGLMVLAVDEIEVDQNRIHDNGSAGVAIVSWQVVAYIASDTPDPEPGVYDRFPETLYLHDNTYTNNGAAPLPLLLAFGGTAPLEDILWDGVIDPMKDNSDGSLSLCVQETGTRFRNAGVTFMGTDIMTAPTTDLAPHDCMHPVRPPVVNGLPRP